MRFYVIGIDDNKEQDFNKEISKIISSNTIFSGGMRHHEIVKEHLPQDYIWINIVVPLSKVFDQYEQHQQVVVFASGDPLFFGFANTILREMPNAEIKLFPSFNSLQLLAHSLLLPYQDMHIVSLTGRPWHKFDEALITGYELIGVLTDNKEHIPSNIAKRMLHYGYSNYTMSIGELLGNKEQEKVTTYALEEVVDKEFSFPNNLILQRTSQRPRPLGISEKEFHLLNGRDKMITKMPIRLLSLSMLDLREKATFWDVGFCTGSVSVEAKLQFPHLQVIAFEQREEGRELIDLNSQRFGTPGIEGIIGDFSQADISEIPAPDAVFIGGHGGKMNAIMSKINEVLLPGGVVVFNSVSEESKQMFEEAVALCKFSLAPTISIKIDDFNVINVMKAIKE